MTTDTTNAGVKDRKRELNVIYFIDSNKTKSFSLDIKGFYAIVAGFCIIICWSFLSIYLLVALIDQSQGRSDRIKHLLTTIFDYQSRYDKIYEYAYPIQRQSKPPSVAAAPAEEPQPTEGEKPGVKLAAKVPPPAAQVVVAKTKTEPAKVEIAAKPAAPEAADVNPESIEIPVRIDGAKLVETGDGITVHFAIRNEKSPKRSVGYVWGLAKFINAAGEEMTISAPTGVKPDATGFPKHLAQAHRFNIRYYKAKNLSFAPPDGTQGHFSDVQIYVSDTSKDSKKGFPVPLENLVRFGKSKQQEPATGP